MDQEQKSIPQPRNKFWFATYDFSNSGFLIIFQSFLFPILLAQAAEGSSINGDTVWSTVVTISSILAIISAPFLGRFADAFGKGVTFAVVVTLTGTLALLSPAIFDNNVVFLAIMFVLFNTFFELSQSLYDSFLLNLEKTKEGIAKLSTFAWGFGYLGGVLFLAVYFIADRIFELNTVTILMISAALFLLLSLPSIESFNKLASKGKNTFKQISLGYLLKTRPPVPIRDIFIYWVIADTVAAITYFAPIFISKEIGLSMEMVGGLLLSGQLLAFPLTILSGRIAAKIGTIKALRYSLIIWFGSLLLLSFANSLTDLIPVIIGLAFVFGSTQSLLRSHFASRIEERYSGEGLGYFAIAQKSASVAAPLIVTVSIAFSDSYRPAIIAFSFLIAAGFFLLPRLGNEKKIVVDSQLTA